MVNSAKGPVMRLQKMFVVAICLVVPLALSAGEGAKVRELDTSKFKIDFEKSRVNKPTVIASAAELDKVSPDAEGLKKQVDFTKEKLVLFAWGGSGEQDQLFLGEIDL